MGALELKDIVLPLATAAGSMGGFAIVGKWLFKGIVQSIETLPSMVKAVGEQGTAIKELFESRNKHQTELDRIMTTHQLRGCDSPIEHTHSRESDVSALALQKAIDDLRAALYANKPLPDTRIVDRAAVPHNRESDAQLSED